MSAELIKYQEHRKNYSERKLWEKIAKHAKRIGRATVVKVLHLYYTAQDDETPKWAKTTIYSSLGYLIFPADAVPDIIPVVGYADDTTVLIAAIATVAVHMTEKTKKQAEEKLDEMLEVWFG